MTARTFTPLCAAIALFAVGCGSDDEDGGSAARTDPGISATGPATTSTVTPPAQTTAGEPAEPADEREITRVIRSAFLEKDPEKECTSYSVSFTRRVYDSTSRCRRVERENAEDDSDPDRVDVQDIRVDGSSAQARAEADGKQTGPFAGGVRLVRERDRWLIQDFDADLLRSILGQALEYADFDADEKKIFRQPAISTCFDREVRELSDDRLKDLAYDAAGDRPGAEDRLGKLLVDCLTSEPAGRKALREQFESSISKDKDLPPGVGECIVRRLRTTVSTAKIVGLIAKEIEGGESGDDAALTRAIQQAAAGCAPQ